MADETTTSPETSTQTSGDQQATQPAKSTQSGSGDDILATFRKDNRTLARRNADLEKQLAELSTNKGKLETELAELRGAAEKAAKEQRESTLLSTLYKQSSQSEFMVRAAYLGAITDGQLQRYPDDPEKAAEEAIKTLSELEPGLFGGQQVTRTATAQSTQLALVGGGVPQSAPPKVTNGQQLPGLLSSAWGGSKK